jgi:hypothetical protein
MKKILFLLDRAYWSLKILFDPAMEGDPYMREEKRIATNFGKISRISTNFKQI